MIIEILLRDNNFKIKNEDIDLETNLFVKIVIIKKWDLEKCFAKLLKCRFDVVDSF